MNPIQIFKNYLANANLEVKQHQLEGVEWLLDQEMNPQDSNNIGGICADEMGLGKTIQMIGLIASNFTRNTLIVLPLSLLYQWENEIKRTLKDKKDPSKIFKPLMYYGKEKTDISLEDLKKAPITLTTYGQLLTKDCLLTKMRWGRVIYDEGHRLRNKNTKLFKIQTKLIRDYTWLVTGTPIQNKPNDIKNLFNIIGLQDVRKKYDEYILSYVLKRTKEECNIRLKKLKIENRIVKYEKGNTHQEKRISKELHGHFSSPKYISSYLSKQEILILILRCRQMCIMPSLIKSYVHTLSEEVETISLKNRIPPELSRMIMTYVSEDDCYLFNEAIKMKSKMNKLCNDLEQNKNTKKSKLLFCSFRKEIDYLYEKTVNMGYIVAIIDGRTSNVERKSILESESVYDILILQISSCSEGLNLQSYSEVYITSPNWNPAMEDQAIARCHRLGQKENVNVYRYVMENFDDEGYQLSLDNYIERIQSNKREFYI
tara:strand:+ start:915 stop:2372 length:1458 start_codon:yes stop_codon:yes gene_type:complete